MYENYHVLFVDDEPNILNSLRRSLMDEEYFCQFAASGEEALEIIRNDPIALLVTDMRMPGMNGLELLNHVAEESPMTVKVVLSGYTQLPQILATINQVDIFKFITKPWIVDELIQAIRKSLDYYILQEENANYKKVLEAKNNSYQNILKKINEVVEDANKSREMLGICGREIIGFGRNYNPEERTRYQNLFDLQEKLFELFSQRVSTKKKKVETTEISNRISDYIQSLFPHGVIDKEDGISGKISMNLSMLETAVETICIVFFDEFRLHGLYAKIQSDDAFALTILSPTADSKKTQNPDSERSLTDMKIELVRAFLEKVLELCGLKFQILKYKESIVIEISLL